jgi:hypothetical protein
VTRGAIPSSSNLKIEVDLAGKDTVVRLTGRVDVDSSPDLRDRLRTLLVGEALPKTIIVDLAAVAVREFRASAYLSREPSPTNRLRNKSASMPTIVGRLTLVTSSPTQSLSAFAPADTLPMSSFTTVAPASNTWLADDWRSSRKSTTRVASRLKSQSPPR